MKKTGKKARRPYAKASVLVSGTQRHREQDWGMQGSQMTWAWHYTDIDVHLHKEDNPRVGHGVGQAQDPTAHDGITQVE